KADHPLLSAWVDENADELLSFKFGVRIPKAPEAGEIVAVAEGARFGRNGHVTLLHFTERGRGNSDRDADSAIYSRWNVRYAAGGSDSVVRDQPPAARD